MKIKIEQIKQHCKILHEHAKKLGYTKEKLSVGSYGQNPATGETLKPKHRSFKISGHKAMAQTVIEWSREQHRNVYTSLAVFHENLGNRKGAEKDIVGILGVALDCDDVSYDNRLPFKHDYVIESSQERYQSFYFYNKQINFVTGKPVAEASTDYAEVDSCSKDLCHVYRIPGTLNWPNKKKVDQGRLPNPQPVKLVKPFTGINNNANDFIRFAKKFNSRVSQPGLKEVEYDFDEWDGSIESLDLSERVKKWIVKGSDSGDRSKDMYSVLLEISQILKDDDILKIFTKYPIGEKYRGAGSNKDEWLVKQINKARVEGYVPPATEDFEPYHSTPIVAVANPFEISDLSTLSAATMGLSMPKQREMFIAGEGGLRKGTIGALAGAGGVGKTKTLIQIAMTVPSGVDCTGGAFDIQQCGSAFLILAEDDREYIGDTIYYTRKRIADIRGINIDDINLTDLYTLCGPGKDFRFMEYDSKGNLKPTGSFNTLCTELIPSIPNLRFIGIDPTSKVFGSVEENSNANASYFTTLIGQLKLSAPEATILLSIHTNKASTTAIDSFSKIDNALHQNAVRGASAFVNDVRWLMTCMSVPERLAAKLGVPDGERLMAWRVAKSNYSPTTGIRYMIRGEGGVLTPFSPPTEINEIDSVVCAIGDLGFKVTKRTALDQLPKRLDMTKADITRLISAAIDCGKLNEIEGLNSQNRKVNYLETWIDSDDEDFLR